MSDSPELNWSRHQWASDKVTNVVVFRGPYIFCVQSTRPLQKTRSSGTIFQNYYYAWQVGLVIRSRLICLHFENNLNAVNKKESEIDLSLIFELKVFKDQLYRSKWIYTLKMQHQGKTECLIFQAEYLLTFTG